jgi:hypothetical protein
MYATCLFCNRALGENHTFESFPVGRRLAFDAAKGRLWVVCRHCERWNLTPLEERWEVIEQAEQMYRDTRRRVSTDQIGLAKLRDGMELVRIGEPLRPEFAAWRYGDQFGRRRRRQMLIAGAGVTAVGALVAGGAAAGVGIGGFGWMLAKVGRTVIEGSPETVVARIQTERGETLHVRRRHLAETSLAQGQDGPVRLTLRYKGGQQHFDGREALRIASIVVPQANRYGGARDTVASAVSEVEDSGGADGFLDRIGKISHVVTRPAQPKRWRRAGWNEMAKTGLFGMNTVQRLALEMALHEEAERRALQGELEELERAWRGAEEIAAIADDMFVPSAVQRSFDRLRGR